MGIISVGDYLSKIKYGNLKRVHSFQDVLNFSDNSGKLLSIVKQKIGNGPFNIVVFDDFFEVIKFCDVECKDGKISFDDYTFNFCELKIWNSRIDSLHPDSKNPHINVLINEYFNLLQNHRILFPIGKYSLQDKFSISVYRNFLFFLNSFKKKQNYEEYLHKFVGCGHGLTPSGDDLLCGFSVGILFFSHSDKDLIKNLNRIYRIIYKKLGFLSRNYLYAAINGMVNEKIKNFLMKFNTEKCVDEMKSVIKQGATSGMDFLYGFFMAYYFLENF